MKSSAFKFSVGYVGFLGHKTGVSCELHPRGASENVGFSEEPKEPDAQSDITAARADARKPLPPNGHPAYSVLTTCEQFGVALRIDQVNGDLVVGKAGAKAEESTQPWPSLLHALERHLEALAQLVESGWRLTAEFPKEAAA